jgi:hypothetical protein
MNIRRFNIKISQAQVDDVHERIKTSIWLAVIAGQITADQNLPI